MGYKNRRAYLQCLSNDNGVSYASVVSLAVVYGPSEDFDGLVTSVEDYADLFAGRGEAVAVPMAANAEGLMDFVSRETVKA
jgi:hypothetical protein